MAALKLLTLILTVEDTSTRGVLSVVKHVGVAVGWDVIHFLPIFLSLNNLLLLLT
jgi:hypothetical protein